MENLIGKGLAFLFQYTIGLLLPWWLVDVINSFLLHGYSSKFRNFNKINRFTFGLILPWWLLLFFEGNKQGKLEGSIIRNREWGFCVNCGRKFEIGRTTDYCKRSPLGAYKGPHIGK